VRSLTVIIVTLTLAVSCFASDYQIVVQEQIDGAENYWHVDPILSSAGDLEGFFSTSGQVHLFTFADGSTTFPEISAGRVTANYMSENNDSLYLFFFVGNLLHRCTIVDDTTIVDSFSVSLPSVGSWSGVMHMNVFYDLVIEPDPRHSRYRVRISMIDAYHNGMIIESAEYHWSAVHLVATDLRRIYTTKPALFYCTGDFRVERGFASIDYRYLRETHRIYHPDWTEYIYYFRVWSTVDIRDGNGAGLHHQEHDERIYRAMYGGDFCHHLPGDELVAEYWNGSNIEDWWSRTDFHLQCLRYGDDSLQEVWSLPVGDMVVQWADQTTGTLAGTGGRLAAGNYYGRYDSLVIFIDASTGQVTDTVNLSRSVITYKFFQTAGDILNLLCRAHDTIFVYQFKTPVDVEEPVVEPARPAGFTLRQNYPNPFNLGTMISYNLDRRQQVKLAVFNVLGQEVVVLYDGVQTRDTKHAYWNGLGRDGHQVASGIYFAQLRGETNSSTIKMMLMK